MNNFENHLLRIAAAIEIDPNDNYIFKKDFEIVRDYVFNIMCQQDNNFAGIFEGALLFGSYANNVRIHCPSEFDVLMKLVFPFQAQIEEQEDYERPGYINLDFTDVCSHMEFHSMDNNQYYYNYDDDLKDLIYDLTMNEFQYLDRTSLKSWLHEVFKAALRAYGNTVRGNDGDLYTLSYAWRGITYTITAKSAVRNFSIDIVPAVEYESATRGVGWYAIPKAVAGPMDTANYTFQICNPSAEKYIIECGGNKNVKLLLRLLQSLRNEKQLPELRCYFLITVCMWELKHQTKQFWHNSIDVLLVHMLNVLCSYFRKGFLPFYWDTDLNLLINFTKNDLKHYEHVLNATYKTLSTYGHQPSLKYSRCASHFDC